MIGGLKSASSSFFSNNVPFSTIVAFSPNLLRLRVVHIGRYVIMIYNFSSPSTKQTRSFNLLDERNLERLGISNGEVERSEAFTYLPGTLYPEANNFTDAHPAGGSFGVHLFLTNGRSAWIYGRISYDTNPHKDHYGGKPHWNYDVVEISSNGATLRPFVGFPYHCLPDSQELNIGICDSEGFRTYKIRR